MMHCGILVNINAVSKWGDSQRNPKTVSKIASWLSSIDFCFFKIIVSFIRSDETTSSPLSSISRHVINSLPRQKVGGLLYLKYVITSEMLLLIYSDILDPLIKISGPLNGHSPLNFSGQKSLSCMQFPIKVVVLWFHSWIWKAVKNHRT